MGCDAQLTFAEKCPQVGLILHGEMYGETSGCEFIEELGSCAGELLGVAFGAIVSSGMYRGIVWVGV